MTSTEKHIALFIGDSFASRQAADCLDKALDVCGATASKNYEVILAGYPGQGLSHFLPDVRKKVDQLRPDTVVQVYPDVDAVHHYSMVMRVLFPTVGLAIKGWLHAKRLINTAQNVHPVLGHAIQRLLFGTVLRHIDVRKGLERDRELYREFAEFLGARGVRYILCFWDNDLYGLTSRFRQTLEFLNGYDHVLFLPDLNNHLSLFHEREYQIPNDGHPNELGNRLMAQYVVEKGLQAGFF